MGLAQFPSVETSRFTPSWMRTMMASSSCWARARPLPPKGWSMRYRFAMASRLLEVDGQVRPPDQLQRLAAVDDLYVLRQVGFLDAALRPRLALHPHLGAGGGQGGQV